MNMIPASGLFNSVLVKTNQQLIWMSLSRRSRCKLLIKILTLSLKLTVKPWKIVLSPTMSSLVGLYGYAGRAASQAWRAMGDHGFGVREVPGSNPGGNPHF